MSQLLDMLQSYRYYKVHFGEPTSTDGNDYQKSYSLAVDTFKAMFRGRLDDWAFLVTDSEAEVLEKLRGWISELRPRQSIEEDSNLSLKACSDRLARLASNTAAADAAPIWPYLRKIKYCKCPSDYLDIPAYYST